MHPSLPEQLTLERMSRTIDACNDLQALRQLCRSLAHAWMTQQAASRWFIAHQGRLTPDCPQSGAQGPQA